MGILDWFFGKKDPPPPANAPSDSAGVRKELPDDVRATLQRIVKQLDDSLDNDRQNALGTAASPITCECKHCKQFGQNRLLLPNEEDDFDTKLGKGGRCNNCGMLVCSGFDIGEEACPKCGSKTVTNDWIKYVVKHLEI